MPVFIRHLEYALAPEIDEQGQIRPVYSRESSVTRVGMRLLLQLA